jgi:hypothetical protein
MLVLSKMKRIFLNLLLATSALCAEPHGPFYSPITGFSDALIPILTAFEKAQVETTLRGFIARADSFPGFRQSDMEPSEHGLYLNVAVRDPEEVKGFSDKTEKKDVFTHRLVQIPPPKGGGQALVIQLDFGREVSADVIRAIDASITAVITFSKQPPKP